MFYSASKTLKNTASYVRKNKLGETAKADFVQGIRKTQAFGPVFWKNHFKTLIIYKTKISLKKQYIFLRKSRENIKSKPLKKISENDPRIMKNRPKIYRHTYPGHL